MGALVHAMTQIAATTGVGLMHHRIPSQTLHLGTPTAPGLAMWWMWMPRMGMLNLGGKLLVRGSTDTIACCLEWLTNAINNKIEGLEERVKKLKLEQGLS